MLWPELRKPKIRKYSKSTLEKKIYDNGWILKQGTSFFKQVTKNFVEFCCTYRPMTTKVHSWKSRIVSWYGPTLTPSLV